MGTEVMLKVVAVLVGLLVVSGLLGWHFYEKQADLSKQVERMKRAIEASDRLVKGANDAERQTINKLQEVENGSSQRAKELRDALARSEGSLRACRLSGDALRVLNRPGVPGAAPVAPGDRSQPDAVEASTGTTCLAVVETFDENHKLYDAVVVQLNECRAFYHRTRSEYCKLTGAC